MEIKTPKPLNNMQAMAFASYGPLLLEELSVELSHGKKYEELSPELQYTFRSIEFVVGESMTVPDESMSIRDILERAARGIIPSGQDGEPYYEEDGSNWSDSNIDRPLYITGLDELTDLDSIKRAKAQLLIEMDALESRLKSASPVMVKEEPIVNPPKTDG